MLSLAYKYEDDEIGRHMTRLHAAAFNKYDLKDVVKYIEEKTYLNGEKFSFKNHEFQRDIISDTSQDVYAQKCAQVGMSEIMARYALAVCRIMPYFNTILTMPAASDSVKFFKTRIDPIISGSPDLRNSIDKDVDNTEIKAFEGSHLYGKGTHGTTSALSVPADLLIHDEVDRSDLFRLQQYQSRLKHSRWQLTRKFGTPTIPGFGIAAAMASSKRMRHMVKCNCCNEWFAPSYHTDVVIPGFDGDKQEIDEHNLMSMRWEDAFLVCPRCGRQPSLQYEHRQWVCENPLDNYTAKGYYVTPFSVPNVVTIAQIVKESTKFSWPEFCNQTLGETSNATSETLTEQDIEQCKFTNGSLLTGDLHCLGIDFGFLCHFVVGRRTTDGMYIVVHRERCQLPQFIEKLNELKQKYRILTSVWDWQPYTTMVLDEQSKDKNLYAGRYVEAPNPELVSIVSKEENAADGQLPLMVAKISRNLHFDNVMKLFKQRKVTWQAQNDNDDKVFIKQCMDMKRVLVPDQFQEGRYRWVKNANDQDHYHHALGYMIIACQLMPTASVAFPLTSIPIARRITIATPRQVKRFSMR